MQFKNSAPAIQLSHSAAVLHVDERGVETLAQHFRETGWLRLPLLFEAPLLERVMRWLDEGDFREVTHDDMGGDTELVLQDCVASRSLELLHNNETLFQLLEEVTDCGRIGSFVGRTYRFLPNSGHGYAWHSDMADTRLLGFSLNLSRKPYLDGQLQLRQLDTPESCQDVINTSVGDAVIFTISEHMEHRVQQVTGLHPKTAYAGWFCREPDFRRRISPYLESASD